MYKSVQESVACHWWVLKYNIHKEVLSEFVSLMIPKISLCLCLFGCKIKNDNMTQCTTNCEQYKDTRYKIQKLYLRTRYGNATSHISYKAINRI